MPKRSVTFTKPPEPKFLKRIKQQIGYQEPDTVETKRQALPVDTNDAVILDDEKPVVVVLKKGDLTEAEFEKEMEPDDASSTKIVFNKPDKRDQDGTNSLDCSSKKLELKKKIKSHNENTKKIKNSSLLSFNDDEEEED